MNPESAFSHSVNGTHGEKAHPSREEYKNEALRDLEEQFVALENADRTEKLGRIKYLLGVAYDRLLALEKEGLLSDEQIKGFHLRAEELNGLVYEEAA